MAAEKSPAFQFYPKDFLMDGNVAVMSLQERGAYITLICICWLEGSLPADISRLARVCGVQLAAFRRFWPAIEPCFRPHPDRPERLVHPRLEKERQKQEQFRQSASLAGKRSAEARKATAVERPLHARSISVATEPQRTLNGSAIGNPTLPSPSPTPVKTTPKNGVVGRYVDRYRERCGGKSPVLTGKETGALSALAKRLGVDEAIAWIDRCFADPDPFWVKRGYPPSSFTELINGLQAQGGSRRNERITEWSRSDESPDGLCPDCGNPGGRCTLLNECIIRAARRAVAQKSKVPA